MIRSSCVFLWFFVIIYSTLACVYELASDSKECPSFESLKSTEQEPKLNRLDLINDGSISVSPIQSGTFQVYSKIKDLRVNGLANGIENSAFDGLTSLYELHLDDNILHVLQAGIFETLPITVIFIYNCAVREIQPKVFDNLPNLKQVYIYGNHFNTVEEGVFTGTKLINLDLKNNRIKQIQTDAFSDMEYLEYLALSNNELKVFDAQDAIGFAPKLTHLYMYRNKLETVRFSVLPNLETLLLNINKIERFPDHIFKDLKKLGLLDVSHNRLTEIQSNVFKTAGQSNLVYFFLHSNKLSYLVADIFVRLPHLQKISIGGNPWQCTCLYNLEKLVNRSNIANICYDDYKYGKRPSCVASDKYPNECIYDLEKVSDIPQIYVDALIDYEQLQPVCHLDLGPIPFLGDYM